MVSRSQRRCTPFRTTSSARLAVALACTLGLLGCAKEPPPAAPAHLRPKVKAMQVEKRTIARTTGQPGFVEAYEQTALYPKISGFIDQWNVDIGATIKAGEVLAHLDRPDIVAQHEEAVANIGLAKKNVDVARQKVNVAEEYWNSAKSKVDQAKAEVGKYKADAEYWTADYKRVHKLYLEKAVEQPVDEASYKHMQATLASVQAAEADVLVTKAGAMARKADLDKAKVDVDAALAQVKVAEATAKRYAALVAFTNIVAPYDGVVIVRNVNTGDFVESGTGDQSAPRNNRALTPAGPQPLYVVARTDKIRIFLDVPEMEANDVQAGTKASVTIPALDDMEFPATIIRTSKALSAKSRTLRAEVDVANPGRRIAPNMYAYGTVEVVRTDVWAIPLLSVTQIGNQNVCYLFEKGNAVQVPIQIGINDGTWVQVTKKRVGKDWQAFNGSEQVLVGDLSELSNGQPVRIGAADADKK